MGQDEALRLVVAFLADSQSEYEPPLAIDAERVRCSARRRNALLPGFPVAACSQPTKRLLTELLQDSTGANPTGEQFPSPVPCPIRCGRTLPLQSHQNS